MIDIAVDPKVLWLIAIFSFIAIEFLVGSGYFGALAITAIAGFYTDLLGAPPLTQITIVSAVAFVCISWNIWRRFLLTKPF